MNKPTAPITKKQLEVLNFIEEHIKKLGFSPSMSVICAAFKWSSTNTAFSYVSALEKKGYIKKTKGKYYNGIKIKAMP